MVAETKPSILETESKANIRKVKFEESCKADGDLKYADPRVAFEKE